MQDKENKVIVDSQGNVITSIKDNKCERFVKDNIWNILSTGLIVISTIPEIINWMFSKTFSVSCSNFYGIDGKYFDGTEMFENKLIFIIFSLILFIYPFILSYTNKKMNNKLYVMLTFILTIFILFFQNLSYLINLIDIIPWAGVRRFIDNYVIIGLILIIDIVIAYFIIIRNFFWKNKKFSICERTVLAIALICYILIVAIGITIKTNYDIADKKEYEVIEQNRAIVSHYDGKFVVMSCEIQDETIILKKGTYSLEDMTGVSITYHKYENVICE